MYPSVCNINFQFLLTVDEFRKTFSHKPSWIKLTTITMISSFKKQIDLQKLRDFFENDNFVLRIKNTNSFKKWFIKPTKFYNQITLNCIDHNSTKSVKIFPNGSIQVAGCSDLINCHRLIKEITFLLQYFDGDIKENLDYRVVMINSNFSLNYNINLLETSQHFSNTDGLFKVSFEPDRYSAVKVKFKPASDMKEVTVSIFSTGKIIITGAETLKEVAFAYNIVVNHINSNPNIRVNEVENKEIFDKFSGYDIEDILEKIKRMGYKSWTRNVENSSIKF